MEELIIKIKELEFNSHYALENAGFAECKRQVIELIYNNITKEKKQPFKCNLDRWFYSCDLYNINKGCMYCKHYKLTS